jgi:L-lactate dehydrogenase
MKIGIVGCGNVGSCSAYACALMGVGTELVLVDYNPDLARAQAEDILHATPFGKSMPISSGDYSILNGAGIVVIAAGVGQKPGETRLDLLKRNADIFSTIVPEIIQAANNAILIVATNPVDIMTDVTVKIASRFNVPPEKIIGSGTILDTARFRTLLGQHLGVSSHSIHAHVLGEHGDSEVLHWSGARVSNLSIFDFASQCSHQITPLLQMDIDQSVRRAAYSIIQGKGATWYGIGAGIARLCQAITENEHAVLTCSGPCSNIEGVENVTLSLPRVVSSQGVERILYPSLSPTEATALRNSAIIIHEATNGLAGQI